jgi:hypothetical protein
VSRELPRGTRHAVLGKKVVHPGLLPLSVGPIFGPIALLPIRSR